MSTELARVPLTKQLMEDFATLVARGNYYVTACKALQIDYASFNRWMRMGKEHTEGIYRDFYLTVTKADAEAEVYAIEAWRQQFPKDWRAPKEFLARRHPDRWGERKQVIVEIDRAFDEFFKHLQRRLPAEVFELVIREAVAISRDKALEAEEELITENA